MKKILSFLLVLALGLVFVGCTNDPVKPTKVEIKAEGDASGLLNFINFKQAQADRRNGL